MKALLLCGYRKSDEGALPLGLERDANGVTLIDRRIGELASLGFEVVCVLAGHSSDEVLRECTKLPEVELVFDTNAEEATLATNLKAGLAGTEGEGCFAIPLEIPCPPRETWNYLRNEWRRIGFQTEISVFRPGVIDDGYGFPLLVSRRGNGLIRRLTGFQSLVDARLKYQHVAPSGNPL